MDQEIKKQETPDTPACAGCGSCAECGGCGTEEVKEDAGSDRRVLVVDVNFRNGCKPYSFAPGSLELKPGDAVIIDTSHGQEYGVVAAGNHMIPESRVQQPLRAVLRRATEKDEAINAENRKREESAFAVCLKKIEEHKLDMQLVSAECAFDGSKLLFFFTAEGRVDFRELVKDLASTLHSRIELRQIGVRDKAKMVGGLGICGRPFCCRDFLEDFEPVSIKMAKTQNLSLNPTQISGTCGRLMCCLKYEQEAYESLLKTTPKAESFVDTPDGRGTVTDVNLLAQTVRVRLEKEPDRFVTCRNDEIYVIRNGKAKKTDPPIPEDFAPISSQPQRRRRFADAPPKEEKIIWADEALLTPEEALQKEAAEAAASEAEETEKKSSRSRSRRGGRRRGGKGGEQPAQEAKPASGEKKPAQQKAAPGEKKPAKQASQPGAAEPPKQDAQEKTGGDRNRRRRRPHRRKSGEGQPPQQ